MITAVIPTLGRHPDALGRCLGSLGSVDVIVVADGPQAAKAVGTIRGARVMTAGPSAGFAGAAQTGIDATESPFVLVLNDDVWLEPGAVASLSDALRDDPRAAGAAPKIRFARWPEILNSVGTVLNPSGEADSRGIGQPDLGQFDRSERVFGCHFAAALVRRELFDPSRVGPLDRSFFAYFEDIDWCLRANVLGLRFVSAPQAVVFHEHSATVRTQPFAFAYRLQERNLMWTAARSFEAARAMSVVSRRLAAHMKGDRTIVRRTLAGLPRVLRSRLALQRRRTTPDDEILALGAGERSWFDQRSSSPVFCHEALRDAAVRSGADPAAHEHALTYLRRLT